MSIRNTDKAKRSKEAKARPDAMHRAVRFLLEQAVLNNRDIKLEAEHHQEILDAELGNAKELEALKKAAPRPEVVKAAPQEDGEPEAEVPAQDTAALLRQSSRFSRRS
jgi:hypothetical protein